MILPIKSLFFTLLLFAFSCKKSNLPTKEFEKEAKSEKKIEQKISTFIFDKSFIFCSSEIGYFSDEEANTIYQSKKIQLNLRTVEIQNNPDEYDSEQIDCLNKNLNLSEISIKYIKYNEEFPFDNLSLINNQYIVVSRDGQFFIFRNDNNQPTNANIQSSNKKFEESLFDKKLIGLAEINEKDNDYFKKYGIDFSSECMCNSPSIFIDTKNKQLILYNYCENSKPLKNIENKKIFKISSMVVKNEILTIKSDQKVDFNFEQIDDLQLFHLNIEGYIPKDYIGAELKSVFTAQPEKFTKVDCGNYDG